MSLAGTNSNNSGGLELSVQITPKKIELKAFHCEILNDHETFKKEIASMWNCRS
ncbi:hypothetical protein [Mucilaginibacter psychrotolerans]|uniref:hypothetical protein n=1 Tax=Mucilaginibacter psychrotolerans TaxID=1524096 RepID=UPI00130543C9|nr:hypothetical protein [Mucilaginibacter psychrotolerans]